MGESVSKMMAGIIAYQFKNDAYFEEAEDEGIVKVETAVRKLDKREKTGKEDIQILVNKVKEIQGYEPILIIFNFDGDIEALKKELGYSKIIFDRQSFNFPQLLKYCSIHERNIKLVEDSEEKIFLDKYKDESFCYRKIYGKIRRGF